MRRFLVFIAAYLLTFSAQSQSRNLDDLVNGVFHALKAKDEAAYLRLYPTGNQLNKMLRAVMEPRLPIIRQQFAEVAKMDSSVTQERIDSLVEASMSMYSDTTVMNRILREAAAGFRKALTAGDSLGVDWASTQFLNYTIDSVAAADQLNMVRSTLTGVQVVKATIDFTASGSSYQVITNKLIYLPLEKGWFGGELLGVVHSKKAMKDTKHSMQASKTKTKSTSSKPKSKSKR